MLANDEGQAADDLDLAKKIVTANPIIAREVEPRAKEIIRRDGRGRMQILPARDIAGAHGKTYLFIGFDEIHAYRSHDLFEALAPDPTRRDALTWITSYAGIRHARGIPLYDLMQAGRRGDDPRMYFSPARGDRGILRGLMPARESKGLLITSRRSVLPPARQSARAPSGSSR